MILDDKISKCKNNHNYVKQLQKQINKDIKNVNSDAQSVKINENIDRIDIEKKKIIKN
jgi:DNA-binding protein